MPHASSRALDPELAPTAASFLRGSDALRVAPAGIDAAPRGLRARGASPPVAEAAHLMRGVGATPGAQAPVAGAAS